MPSLPPEKPNPWKTHTDENVYESPWIKVSKHAVTTPSGDPGTYSVVHFKNLAIGILPLDDARNTWLVGQYRYPLKQYTWEIPEGGCPEGTDPLESAQRELKEETGLTATRWTKLMDMHLSNSATDEYCIIYVAQGISEGEAHPEPDEDLQVVKIPFEEVYQLVLNGTLTDSLTVAAVLRWKIEMDA